MFAGATIHYLVAPIGGTLLYGRGWYGYACLTVAILDLLPWKQPKEGRVSCLGLFRHVHLFDSLGLDLYILFVLQSLPEQLAGSPLERRRKMDCCNKNRPIAE